MLFTCPVRPPPKKKKQTKKNCSYISTWALRPYLCLSSKLGLRLSWMLCWSWDTCIILLSMKSNYLPSLIILILGTMISSSCVTQECPVTKPCYKHDKLLATMCSIVICALYSEVFQDLTGTWKEVRVDSAGFLGKALLFSWHCISF